MQLENIYLIIINCTGRYTAPPPSHDMDSSYITFPDWNYINYSCVHISYSYIYIHQFTATMSISQH
jgi:hypothetical protein